MAQANANKVTEPAVAKVEVDELAKLKAELEAAKAKLEAAKEELAARPPAPAEEALIPGSTERPNNVVLHKEGHPIFNVNRPTGKSG